MVDLVGFGKNLLFAFVLLLIVGSISYADLPLTNRFEEYIAFVLTTDFDYQAWFDQAEGTSLFDRIGQWRSWLPWSDGGGAGGNAVPVGPSDAVR